MRFLKLILIVTALLLPVVAAQAANTLLTTSVNLEQHSQQGRQQALQKAMAQVLQQISSNASLVGNQKVQALIDNPRPYVNSIAYGDKQQLIVSFSKQRLERALDRLNLDYVKLERRPLLLFLTITSGGESNLISDNRAKQINQTISQIASQRGLMLDFPKQQALAKYNIDHSVAKVIFKEELQQFATAHGYSDFAIANLNLAQQVGAANWYLYQQNEAKQRQLPAAASLNQALEQGIYYLASEQQSQASSSRGGREISALISGINNLSTYTNCILGLKRASRSELDVTAVIDDKLLVKFMLNESLETLKQQLARSANIHASSQQPAASTTADIYLNCSS